MYILISRRRSQSETDSPDYVIYIQKVKIAFAL